MRAPAVYVRTGIEYRSTAVRHNNIIFIIIIRIIVIIITVNAVLLIILSPLLFFADVEQVLYVQLILDTNGLNTCMYDIADSCVTGQ